MTIIFFPKQQQKQIETIFEENAGFEKKKDPAPYDLSSIDDLILEYYKLAEPVNQNYIQDDNRELEILAIPFAGSMSTFVWIVGLYFFLFGSISLPFAPSLAPSLTIAPTSFTPVPTRSSASPSETPLFMNAFLRTLLKIVELFNSVIQSIVTAPAPMSIAPAPTVRP